MNSKQLVAAVSAIILVIILVYPALSVGTVSVSLTSTRIQQADHVYITISSVWAHQKGQTAASAWILILNQSVTADLVSLPGSPKLLGSGQISSGDYDSIRIAVSNVTWAFNKTTTVLGISSSLIEGTVNFTVAAASPTNILITLNSQKQLIANSEYFAGTLNATVTT